MNQKIPTLVRVLTLVALMLTGVRVSSGQADAPADQRKDLRLKLRMFDDLIKSGAEAGELDVINNLGAIGADNFAKAGALIDECWSLATVLRLVEDDIQMFEEIATAFLAFHHRTSTAYHAVREKVKEGFGGKTAADARVHYLLGLGCFRESQFFNKPELFKQSLEHLDEAIKRNEEFPEAHWLKSQIYASWGDRIKSRSGLEAVKKYASQFSPSLFLYDTSVIRVIKTAVGVPVQ